MDRRKEALRKHLLGEIIQGYSIINVGEHRRIHVKHFDSLDIATVDETYLGSLDLGLAKGLLTSEDALKEAIENGRWTEEKTKKIESLNAEIANARLTLSKTILTKQRERINKDISDMRKQAGQLDMEKNEIISHCADIFALKKTNEFFIYFACRKRNLKEFYFSESEFDELEQEEMIALIDAYNAFVKKFDYEEMKKIAISSAFMNLIAVAGDDIYSFFGKPVIELTHKQLDIYSLGRQYRSALSEAQGKLTEDILENPDKLIEFVDSKRTAEEFSKTLDQDKAGGVSVVGATQEDLKKMGLENQPGTSSLQEAAAAAGKKSLDMWDMLKLHGE